MSPAKSRTRTARSAHEHTMRSPRLHHYSREFLKNSSKTGLLLIKITAEEHCRYKRSVILLRWNPLKVHFMILTYLITKITPLMSTYVTRMRRVNDLFPPSFRSRSPLLIMMSVNGLLSFSPLTIEIVISISLNLPRKLNGNEKMSPFCRWPSIYALLWQMVYDKSANHIAAFALKVKRTDISRI